MGRKKQNGSVASKALKAGIPKGTVYARLRLGWSMEKALSVPVQKTSPKKPVPKKPVPKKPVPKKPVPKKPVPKKTVPKKTVPKKTVPKKTVPKNNPMFVEKYSSNKPSKLVLWGLAVVAIMFIVKLIGG